ncbi:hypothetical protein D3C78_374450 [compost metagenome]
MGAVGRDEVDQGQRMLDAIHEVDPAGVGLQLAVAGHRMEFAACGVEGRNAGVTATGDVDGGQVERQAQQVVAQGLGDELVDLVALLARCAADDGAGCLFRGQAAVGEFQRIEEGGNQADLATGEIGIETVDFLGQHGVAEAVHGVGELGDDGRIDGAVESIGRQERIDEGLHLAGELFEHQVLVLHLGAELGGLEQALAIPFQGCDSFRGSRNRAYRSQQPLVEEGQVVGCQDHVLGVFQQAIVFRVENMVNGGQADVFVDPAITCDVVGIQQLVVVEAGSGRWATGYIIGIRSQGGAGLAVERIGGMSDVVEEGMAGAHGTLQADRRVRVAFHQHVIGGARQAVRADHHHLREAIRALDEVAVGVGGQQRDAAHIGIGQVDAEEIAGLGLDHRPGGHAADFHVVAGAKAAVWAQVAVGDQATGGHRLAIGVELVGTQEYLVRRVRAVGLVLVDEGRGGVPGFLGIVGGADNTIVSGTGELGGSGQDQEVGRAARDEQRIVRLQGDEHHFVAALGHQVQAMVEELAEEGEPGVERRREPFVRRGVGQEQRLPGRNGNTLKVQQGALGVGQQGNGIDLVNAIGQGAEAGIDEGLDRRRVGDCLVDDQVADGPRLRVDHHAAAFVGGTVLPWTEYRIEHAREEIVRRAELFLPRHHVVERTIDSPEPPGHLRVGQE